MPHKGTAEAEAVFRLVASGRATSKADLARALGVAPSTAAQRVRELLRAGLVEESGAGASTGGRRPTALRVPAGAALVGAIDLGARHASLAVASPAPRMLGSRELTIDIGEGPEAVLEACTAGLHDLAEGLEAQLAGVGVALPGPVDVTAGCVTAPSRMPGWAGFDVRGWLERRLGLPVAVENDANAMAYAEWQLGSGLDDIIVVKAGTGIGAGLVLDGRVVAGANSAAGDISHARAVNEGALPCACGNFGCLETVASGAALAADLAAQGKAVVDASDVVELAATGDAAATTAVRAAGAHLGHALAAVVNFTNPAGVYLGGALSACSPFVAAVKSQLYQDCHPLATEHLDINATSTGAEGGVCGAALLAVDAVVARACGA
jgi:predicted NBD/HSP70 family sugar kinase